MRCTPALLIAFFASAAACAESPFNGTWRPDPQRFDASRPPDVMNLANGQFACASCKPPYTIRADGTDQPIEGNERYDTMQVRVLNDHAISRIAKMKGVVVVEIDAHVSADLKTLTERQIISGAGPRKIDFTSHSARVAPTQPGSHAISGSWQLIDADLTNHDEDTRFSVTDGRITMSDQMGRSFAAKLDGTDAPYKGDAQFTSVSVRQIDPRTIEESDKKNGSVVKITRWTVAVDGKRIHARFDDTHGHIQEQDGTKIAP